MPVQGTKAGVLLPAICFERVVSFKAGHAVNNSTQQQRLNISADGEHRRTTPVLTVIYIGFLQTNTDLLSLQPAYSDTRLTTYHRNSSFKGFPSIYCHVLAFLPKYVPRTCSCIFVSFVHFTNMRGVVTYVSAGRFLC